MQQIQYEFLFTNQPVVSNYFSPNTNFTRTDAVPHHDFVFNLEDTTVTETILYRENECIK